MLELTLTNKHTDETMDLLFHNGINIAGDVSEKGWDKEDVSVTINNSNCALEHDTVDEVIELRDLMNQYDVTINDIEVLNGGAYYINTYEIQYKLSSAEFIQCNSKRDALIDAASFGNQELVTSIACSLARHLTWDKALEIIEESKDVLINKSGDTYIVSHGWD